MNDYNDYSFYYNEDGGGAESGGYRTPEPPKKKRRAGKILALSLAGVLAAGGIFGVGFAAKSVFDRQHAPSTNIYYSTREPVTVEQVKVDGSRELSFTELYAANVNSCVSINVSTTRNIFGQTTRTASAGSGFIITEDGYIVTNCHVVSGGGTVQVTLYDGTTYNGTVVGSDEEYDIAVVKIDATGLQPVVIGDSSALQVGNDVAAIGNPLGELTFSMSEGIVSCVDRLINVEGTPFNMIQVTAAVNSGNSGGPLFNRYGEVVGIVSAKYSTSSNGTSVEGLGFAIPINDVAVMIQDIITNGYVSNKPYLGVTAGTFTAQMIPNSVVSEGAYLYSVEPDSAAAKAGLLAGDIITKVGDTAIATYDDLASAKKNYRAGDSAIIEYYRANQRYTTRLTFDPLPAESTVPSQQPVQQPTQGGGYFDPWQYFNDYFNSFPGSGDSAA